MIPGQRAIPGTSEIGTGVLPNPGAFFGTVPET